MLLILYYDLHSLRYDLHSLRYEASKIDSLDILLTCLFDANAYFTKSTIQIWICKSKNILDCHSLVIAYIKPGTVFNQIYCNCFLLFRRWYNSNLYWRDTKNQTERDEQINKKEKTESTKWLLKSFNPGLNSYNHKHVTSFVKVLTTPFNHKYTSQFKGKEL